MEGWCDSYVRHGHFFVPGYGVFVRCGAITQLKRPVGMLVEHSSTRGIPVGVDSVDDIRRGLSRVVPIGRNEGGGQRADGTDGRAVFLRGETPTVHGGEDVTRGRIDRGSAVQFGLANGLVARIVGTVSQCYRLKNDMRIFITDVQLLQQEIPTIRVKKMSRRQRERTDTDQ